MTGRCRATTKAGRPCRQSRLVVDGLCVTHAAMLLPDPAPPAALLAGVPAALELLAHQETPTPV